MPKKISMQDLYGDEVNVGQYVGKEPVILVFWKLMMNKSFLDYSLDELIFLNDYYQKYSKSKELKIIGIYTPENEGPMPADEMEMVRNLIKTNKIDFPILIDSGYKAFREFGVIALPSTIMIDRSGSVKFIYPSFPLSARQLFADEIMELVGIAQPSQEDETAKIKRSETRSHRLYRYSLQMYKRGLYEQAISPLSKSIELDPNYIWSKNLRGIIFAQSGDFDNSVAAFKQAMSIDPNNVMPSFNYGVLLYENGRYGDAETQFTKSLAMNSQLAEANYFLGLVFQRTNKPDRAMEAFEKALEIDRTHESAQSRQALILYSLSELYEKKGDIATAFSYLKKAVKEAVARGDKTAGTISVRNRDLMLYE